MDLCALVGRGRSIAVVAFYVALIAALPGCFSVYHDDLAVLEDGPAKRLDALAAQARARLERTRADMHDVLDATRHLASAGDRNAAGRRADLALRVEVAELGLIELHRAAEALQTLAPAVSAASVARLRDAELAGWLALAPIEDGLPDWSASHHPLDRRQVKTAGERLAQSLDRLTPLIKVADRATESLAAGGTATSDDSPAAAAEPNRHLVSLP